MRLDTAVLGGDMSKTKIIKIHECTVCGIRAMWGASWRHKLILHRVPVPWDEIIKCCSDKCIDAYERKPNLYGEKCK